MSRLTVIATPIGNLEDITLRALRALGEVGALACEDTRRTGRLLEHHGIPKPSLVFSYHEHNEGRAADRILGLLADGVHVGLCSNAGYPGISDPGYSAVSSAAEAGYAVEVIPGASAVPVALIASGLPTSSYTFRGFPPRKAGRRKTFLEEGRLLPHTLVFYESPYRLGKFLAAALEVLGDRRAAVCLELTKRFERVHRGWLSDLAAEFASGSVRGEATVVVAGHHPKFTRGDHDSEP